MPSNPPVSAALPLFDLSPVLELLTRRFEGDPKEVASQLYQVQSYLLHEPTPGDTAAQLRHVCGIVGALAAAFDESAAA